jgi:hypothetical protein
VRGTRGAAVPVVQNDPYGQGHHCDGNREGGRDEPDGPAKGLAVHVAFLPALSTRMRDLLAALLLGDHGR